MREQDAWDEHASFMDDLAARGVIALGGPLGDGGRILLIVRAQDEDEARRALDDDPWSGMGLLVIAEMNEWTVLLNSGA